MICKSNIRSIEAEKERNWQSCISTYGITNKRCVTMSFVKKVMI